MRHASARKRIDARLNFTRRARLPAICKGQPIDWDPRMDIVVEDALGIEIKAVQALNPIHDTQLLTDLRLRGLRVGLLYNFNEVRLADGLRRRLLRL